MLRSTALLFQGAEYEPHALHGSCLDFEAASTECFGLPSIKPKLPTVFKGTQTSQVSRLTTSHVCVKPWNAWLLMRRVMVGALGCMYWDVFFDGFCMVSKPPPMSSASSPRVLEVGEDTEPAVESYFATSAVPETIDESIFDGSFTWVLVTWYMSRSIYQNLPESTRIHQNLPVVLM